MKQVPALEIEVSPKRLWFQMALCILAGGTSAGIVLSGMPISKIWALLCILALVSPVALTLIFLRLIRGGLQLRIGQTGIDYPRWSDQTIRWSDIAWVKQKKVYSHHMIMIGLYPAALSHYRKEGGAFSSFARRLVEEDISIAISGLERTPDEIMAAIQAQSDGRL